jgi:signal transduction histidine kinase
MELEKYLEIVLYNVVGGITGFLSQKEEMRRKQLQQTARGLEESYIELQRQSDVIIEIEGELRKAERLSTIGELAAMLAHEIRNPLASIQGTAEILKDDFRPGDKKYEFLDILIKESGRLNRVVEDFLRLARPQPVMMGRCDVMEELNNVITLVAAEAKKRNVRLELKPARVPSIDGDPEKLRQAFWNIILNALQATPPGGVVSVAVSCNGPDNGDTGGWVEICLSDTGKGIPAGLAESIFEPFFTTKADGTGLGLAITRKIVESHGGTISVESEIDRGTSVTVRLQVRNDSGGGSVEIENTCN